MKATDAMTKEELANLSEAERAAIEGGDEDALLSHDDLEALREIASEGEDERRPRLPRYDVKPVENYDAQMTAIDAEYDAALNTFKDGDLSIEELLAKQRELDGKRLDLRAAKTCADMAQDFNNEAGKAEWMGEVQDFFAQVNTRGGR